jgi:large conductance mechanosensitive channel
MLLSSLTQATSKEDIMLEDFKAFALRGNVLDMAVGIIIGAAFGTIISSLVNDIIMPPIGLLLGGLDFSNLYILLKGGSPAAPYPSLADAQAAGAVSINYGLFVNAVVSFLIVAFVMFLLIRSFNRLTQEEEAPPTEPTTKACPYCMSEIPIGATRCPACTSQLATA